MISSAPRILSTNLREAVNESNARYVEPKEGKVLIADLKVSPIPSNAKDAKRKKKEK